MCYRPADVSISKDTCTCPSCGRTIQALGGTSLNQCPFCHEIITVEEGDTSSCAIDEDASNSESVIASNTEKSPASSSAPSGEERCLKE